MEQPHIVLKLITPICACPFRDESQYHVRFYYERDKWVVDVRCNDCQSIRVLRTGLILLDQGKGTNKEELEREQVRLRQRLIEIDRKLENGE